MWGILHNVRGRSAQWDCRAYPQVYHGVVGHAGTDYAHIDVEHTGNSREYAAGAEHPRIGRSSLNLSAAGGINQKFCIDSFFFKEAFLLCNVEGQAVGSGLQAKGNGPQGFSPDPEASPGVDAPSEGLV